MTFQIQTKMKDSWSKRASKSSKQLIWMSAPWAFALKLSTMEKLLGDAWIAKKTPLASFVVAALKSQITRVIEFSLKETLEAAVTVVIQKLGIRSTFAQIIRDMKRALRRSWTNYQSKLKKARLKCLQIFANSSNSLA